jgi:hypothetical protein
MSAQDAGDRKAPYAPVSALRDFFAKIQDVTAPPKVDRLYVQKLGVASNNEWALLSALKFLGVVDEHGTPTSAYRRLQTTEGFEASLRYLVERAYAPLIAVGGLTKTDEALIDYFRITSSASQAKNAARFFREVAQLAGLKAGPRLPADPVPDQAAQGPTSSVIVPYEPEQAVGAPHGQPAPSLLATKLRLLEKLPAPQAQWSAAEYEAICRHFVEMLRSLDATSQVARDAI